MQRFDIKQVFEGWGSTEANCGLMNVDNKVGSCGRIPYQSKSNIRLVRYDADRDQHIKDSQGSLTECAPGEVGEVIAMILDLPSGATRFEGYTDPGACEKKILRNVFTAGDAWYRSGDLFRRDNDDYYYFVDRVGDTFRWKSENVSSMEVADTLSGFPGIEIINIYGVTVPQTEGRAGMASLVMQTGHKFDPVAFYQYCNEHLPRYAVPLFVRLSQQAEMTTTFKLRKVDLQKQGYSLSLVKDPLFVVNDEQEQYVPLTEEKLKRQNIPPFEAE